MNREGFEIKEIKINKFKGLGRLVSDRTGCSLSYVNMILSGNRAVKSEKSRQVVQEAYKIVKEINK